MKSDHSAYIQWPVVLFLSILLSGCLTGGNVVEGKRAYYRGEYASAYSLLQVAADEENNPEALWYLSRMYADGDGVPKDEAKALELLQRSAEMGCHRAQYDLGIQYLFGKGVPRDDAKAASLFQASAAQGNEYAMAFLGILYATGTGVEKNLTVAVNHFRQAKENGYNVPQELLTEEGIADYRPKAQ